MIQEIVKRLNITPVIQDIIHNKKWLSWTGIRSVGLVRQAVVVPAITINTVGFQVPYIVGQFNYTVPKQFRLTDFGTIASSLSSLSNCAICIRHRVGITVTRYLLVGGNTVSIPSTQYSGQLILPNFVVEIWQLNNNATCGIVNALGLLTSVVRDPASADDYLPDAVNLTQTATLAMLQAPLPEPLPTTYDPSGSWITN